MRLGTDIREIVTNAGPVIGGFFGALGNDPGDYIAGDVLPSIAGADAAAFSGNLLHKTLGSLFGDIDADDAFPIGHNPNRHGGDDHVRTPYLCQGWGLEHVFDTRALEHLPLMGESAVITSLQAQYAGTYETMKLLRERRVNALFQNAAWAVNAAAPGLWTNPLTDIIGDIDALLQNIENAGARTPNAMILRQDHVSALRVAPQLLNWLPTTVDRNRMTNSVVIEFLRDHFELDIVKVCRARGNIASAGLAPNIQPVWANSVWAGYLPHDGAGKAGTAGVMQGPGEALVTTPTAVVKISPREWTWNVNEYPNPYLIGYLGDYVETFAAGGPMLQLGGLMTVVV